jgi:hypothetical protein
MASIKLADARASLLKLIDLAFADTRYPGNDRLSVPNGDLEIEAFTGYINWQDVPLEIFPRENAALNFFSPEAFQFFLPAYMQWVIKDFKKRGSLGSLTIDSMINILDPFAKKTDYEYAISKFALLTPPQRNTVAQFLEFLINYAEQYVDLKAASHGLSRYWYKYRI